MAAGVGFTSTVPVDKPRAAPGSQVADSMRSATPRRAHRPTLPRVEEAVSCEAAHTAHRTGRHARLNVEAVQDVDPLYVGRSNGLRLRTTPRRRCTGEDGARRRRHDAATYDARRRLAVDVGVENHGGVIINCWVALIRGRRLSASPDAERRRCPPLRLKGPRRSIDIGLPTAACRCPTASMTSAQCFRDRRVIYQTSSKGPGGQRPQVFSDCSVEAS